MTQSAQRIDVHQHAVPTFYRDALTKAGIAEAGGRALPDWSAASTLELMDLLDTRAAILSVSTPGTGFLTDPAEASALAQRLNDHCATSGLEGTVDAGTGTAINHTNAEALFPRLATAAPRPPRRPPAPVRLRQGAQRTAARLIFKLLQPGTN